MSPVRVWEAGPEITQIEKVQREHLYIKKAFKVCSQCGQKTAAKELKCPNSVEAYHGALSRLRLGFESRFGRYKLNKARLKPIEQKIFFTTFFEENIFFNDLLITF